MSCQSVVIKLLIVFITFHNTFGDRERRDSDCIIANLTCPNSNVTFWLYTKNTQNEPFQLNVGEPESIKRARFIPGVPVKILIHGYTGYRDYAPNAEIRPAYFEKGEYNVISVDWNPLAREPCYVQATRNVPTVGKCLAQLIDTLIYVRKIPLEDFHVIGFSLGAHVSGAIAVYIKSGKLRRVTGLDPALPLFATPNDDDKLDKTDAEFVDVIHTNALERGKLEACGHADFYMNGGMSQPGCDKQPNMSTGSCNHWRAPVYYAESINSKLGFYGMKCSSWFLFMLGWCTMGPDTEEMIMGEYTPETADGLFFVSTNAEEPFAKGKWADQQSTTQPPSTLIV